MVCVVVTLASLDKLNHLAELQNAFLRNSGLGKELSVSRRVAETTCSLLTVAESAETVRVAGTSGRNTKL